MRLLVPEGGGIIEAGMECPTDVCRRTPFNEIVTWIGASPFRSIFLDK